MRPWATRLTVSFLVSAVPVFADIIVFKDGTRVNGSVRRIGDSKIAIEIDSGRMTVPEADVDTVIPVRPKEQPAPPEPPSRRERQMGQLTGVTEKVREKLERQLRILGTGTDRERLNARLALIELGKKGNITSYLRVMMRYAPSLIPELADVLAETDPKNAVGELERLTSSTKSEFRARAISTLMRIDGDAGLPYAAAGLLDEDPEVRMTAATALAKSKDRRATLFLIRAMKSGDRRVSNASRDALSAMWSTSDQRVDFSSADDWERFWKSRSDTVPGALDPTHLAPGDVGPLSKNEP